MLSEAEGRALFERQFAALPPEQMAKLSALALRIDAIPVRHGTRKVWAPAWGYRWFVDQGMAGEDLERLHRDWGQDVGAGRLSGMSPPILVTGAAGFIGSHVAKALVDAGETVVGVDRLGGCPDPALQRARLRRVKDHPGFTFCRLDLADRERADALFADVRPRKVVHLAAQSGVRQSLVEPHGCVESNVAAFLNVLEGCRHNGVQHLVYASSSSVYGDGGRGESPLSLYAATKRANELMAASYGHLFALRTTGLRFFTVYGPWGRPDMAPALFAQKIAAGEPVDVFGHGEHARDFTYIDDAVQGVVEALGEAPTSTPFQVRDVGSGRAVPVLHFIALLEQAIGRKAVVNLLPRQPGDALTTCASVGGVVATPVEIGVPRFVEWWWWHDYCQRLDAQPVERRILVSGDFTAAAQA